MAINNVQLQDFINKEYQNINEQERALTDLIEGHIKVIVQSGTNLTRSLTLRIAKILSSPATVPPNILCLTGSVSASVALQHQIDTFIGKGLNQVTIHTVQTFYQDVLQQNAPIFKAGVIKKVSPLEQIQILKELINAFPKDNPLKRFRSDVYHEINNLMNLFSFLQKERLDPDFLSERIDVTLNSLNEAAQKFAGPEDVSIIVQKELLIKLKAGIKEFEYYKIALQKKCRYDADDVIAAVINAFETDTNFLLACLQKYQYIQFGDFNAANPLIHKLKKLLPAADCKANILVVEHENEVDDATAEIHKWNTILLANNDNNHTARHLPNKPTINAFNSTDEEIAAVTNEVYELIQLPAAPEKIAVICLQDAYRLQLESCFDTRKFFFYSKRSIDILTTPFIKKIIQLLRYISIENKSPFSGDELLFEILHFDFYQVPPFEIAKLSVEVNSRRYGKVSISLRELLKEKATAPAKDLFDPGMNEEMKNLHTILEKLIETAGNTSLQEIVINLWDQEQVFSYIEKSSNSIWLKQLSDSFSNFIKNETTQNSNLQLNELIAALDTMQQQGLPVYLNKVTGSRQGVHLIGLDECAHYDFDYVFITGANTTPGKSNDWLNRSLNDRDSPFANYTAKQKENQNFLIKQVLANVLSRKNGGVFISFAKFNKNNKPLLPNDFVAELLSTLSIKENNAGIAGDLSSFASLRTVQQPVIAAPDKNFIASLLNKFVMNVSALNSYLNCPLGFYYKYILRIPNSRNEAMEFGSAIHYALENLFKKMSAGFSLPVSPYEQPPKKDQFPSSTEMIADFKLYMHKNRSHFSDEAFSRRIDYGENVLQNYYYQYINSWNKVVSIERNISGVSVNGVPLKGKLDKLEFNGKDVTIVDYKSGDIEKAISKLKPPHDEQPNGGDYWRQAVFYKILVDNYNKKDWRVTGAEFDFIEPDKHGAFRKLTLTVTDPDIETVKQQITTVWEKIQAHDFYTGCGEPDCHWCNFVKDNGLSVV